MLSSLLSFCNGMIKKIYILTTSNQNEIQISTRISWKEIAGLQNTKDDKIIRLSDHGMTFWFRLFQKSSLAANVWYLYLSLWKKLSHFLFLRVSVFIRNSSHKTRLGFIIFLTYTARIFDSNQCSKSFKPISCYTVDRQLMNVIRIKYTRSIC